MPMAIAPCAIARSSCPDALVDPARRLICPNDTPPAGPQKSPPRARAGRHARSSPRRGRRFRVGGKPGQGLVAGRGATAAAAARVNRAVVPTCRRRVMSGPPRRASQAHRPRWGKKRGGGGGGGGGEKRGGGGGNEAPPPARSWWPPRPARGGARLPGTGSRGRCDLASIERALAEGCVEPVLEPLQAIRRRRHVAARRAIGEPPTRRPLPRSNSHFSPARLRSSMWRARRASFAYVCSSRPEMPPISFEIDPSCRCSALKSRSRRRANREARRGASPRRCRRVLRVAEGDTVRGYRSPALSAQLGVIVPISS